MESRFAEWISLRNCARGIVWDGGYSVCRSLVILREPTETHQDCPPMLAAAQLQHEKCSIQERIE